MAGKLRHIRRLDDTDQFYVRLPKEYVEDLGTREVYLYRDGDNALIVSSQKLGLKKFDRKTKKRIWYTYNNKKKIASYYLVLPYAFMVVHNLEVDSVVMVEMDGFITIYPQS